MKNKYNCTVKIQSEYLILLGFFYECFYYDPTLFQMFKQSFDLKHFIVIKCNR